MGEFGIVPARIAAFFVESVILGLYLVTFGYTTQAIFTTGSRWKRIGELNHPMAIVASLMFFNVTMASATSFLIIWRAFVDTPPGGAEVSFKEISYWGVVLKSATLLFQTTIGDAMLIYRCWVVYGRSYLVVTLSTMLWIGGTVCSIIIIYYESTFKEHVLVSAGKLHPYGVAFWASTVSLNIITTALLVWPIWKVARNHDEFAYRDSGVAQRPNTMKHVMHVIIESGLLYTVTAFMTFVTYTANSNSLYVVSSAEVGVAGIAFNLIIIRTSNATRAKYGSTAERGSTLPLHIISPQDASGTTGDKSQVRIMVSQETVQHKYAKPIISGDSDQSRTKVEQESY
ncbi:hypothetical protein LshimejAT787_1000440 [Lyophyllum shimeji]|uniref:Uncharacterized protein n=1 Tax=Lyophyllum shimeji TaxID=47721 RepID=A0A9P3PTW5_LYOSH|nr:hypothetical protein LshimejAT787_1000440 [Lyophyllum shimeji]